MAGQIVEYTKDEIYAQLKNIGTTNTTEKELVNVLTGEKDGTIVITDNDRNYYWMMNKTNEGKFRLVDQGSLFL